MEAVCSGETDFMKLLIPLLLLTALPLRSPKDASQQTSKPMSTTVVPSALMPPAITVTNVPLAAVMPVTTNYLRVDITPANTNWSIQFWRCSNMAKTNWTLYRQVPVVSNSVYADIKKTNAVGYFIARTIDRRTGMVSDWNRIK